MTQDLEFDFVVAERERPIMEHFARLEALAREEMSEENLCLAWVTQSDGRAWKDWWIALPNYERSSMLASYRSERSLADAMGRPMCPHKRFIISKEEIEQNQAVIDKMVADIRQAAVERKPVPLRESEGMSPFERLLFKGRLSAAFLQAGVVVISEQPGDS